MRAGGREGGKERGKKRGKGGERGREGERKNMGWAAGGGRRETAREVESSVSAIVTNEERCTRGTTLHRQHMTALFYLECQACIGVHRRTPSHMRAGYCPSTHQALHQ